MPIADRKLSPGTALVARYKGTTYRAEVVQTEQGLRYRLEDGQEFKSPSSAASAVMGGKSVNGWSFWSVASGEDSASKEASVPEPAPKPAASKSKKGGAKQA